MERKLHFLTSLIKVSNHVLSDRSIARREDLKLERVSTIIRKGQPRTISDRGYLIYYILFLSLLIRVVAGF
jgi:hypothetical protein